MSDYAMLVNYGYCTGCHSCEIACRNEKDLPLDEWGIKVLEEGPEMIQGGWEWNYIAVPSRACDLCVERIAEGLKPSCELHCLAHVIEVIPLQEASEKLAGYPEGKVSVYIP